MNILKSILEEENTRGKLPRDDYRESGELALVMLGVLPKRWDKPRWAACGAFHHARWMHLLMYGPKMLAFHDQCSWIDEDFLVKLEKFVLYRSLIHVRYWLMATWGSDQPYLMLCFYQDLKRYFLFLFVCSMLEVG